jgi:Zn-dependent protease
MLVLKSKNCTMYVNPLVAVAELAVIFCLVHVIPSVADPGLNSLDYLLISFLVLIGSLCSLYAHEYAHTLAARWMRLQINGITVSVVGAFTSIESQPSTPKEAFIVSVAGPLMNILIAAFFYGGHIIFRHLDILGAACFCLAAFNGIFSTYNLLPVMPLDGGFIVRSAFWTASRNWGWSTRISFKIGTGFILASIAAGIVNIFIHNRVMGVISIMVGLSLLQSERAAYQQTAMARFMSVLCPRHR